METEHSPKKKPAKKPPKIRPHVHVVQDNAGQARICGLGDALREGMLLPECLTDNPLEFYTRPDPGEEKDDSACAASPTPPDSGSPKG